MGTRLALVLVFVMAACSRPATVDTRRTDADVTAAMQAAIIRELPSWRGIIAEVGGKPDIAARAGVLFVSTTLSSSQTDGLNDLCVAVSVWAKGLGLTNVAVIRGNQQLVSCRV